jgi:cytochrome c55X
MPPGCPGEASLRCIKFGIVQSADDGPDSRDIIVRICIPRLFAVLVAVLAAAAPAFASADPGTARQRELVTLVRQDCGSCHGMTFKGGLGPPLTPEALREKPSESLTLTILNGRPGTPMPPWRQFVSEAEATWIVDQLQKGFRNENR